MSSDAAVFRGLPSTQNRSRIVPDDKEIELVEKQDVKDKSFYSIAQIAQNILDNVGHINKSSPTKRSVEVIPSKPIEELKVIQMQSKDTEKISTENENNDSSLGDYFGKTMRMNLKS